jgi:hypothetical protein
MRAYQLDSNQLHPGDVLLEAGSGLFSFLIRWLDGGPYSHSVLYLGHNIIVEAVERGVIQLPAGRLITTQPENYAVFQYPDAERLAQACGTIVAFAETNKRYAWTGVYGVKLPIFKRRAYEHFCSELVARSYAHAGLPLFTGCDPDKVSPNDFARPPCLLERLTLRPFTELPTHFKTLRD